MPTVTENGVTFFRSDLTPHTSVVNADGENTTVDLTIDSVTLNFTKDTVGDPDVVFNTETSVFQFFEDDYLEDNPSTTSPIISYVGQYYSDTINKNTFQIEDEAPSGTGTRFSNSSLSFDSTSVKFDRVFT